MLLNRYVFTFLYCIESLIHDLEAPIISYVAFYSLLCHVSKKTLDRMANLMPTPLHFITHPIPKLVSKLGTLCFTGLVKISEMDCLS